MIRTSGYDTVVVDGQIDLIADYDAETGVFTAIKEYEYPQYNGETVVIPRAEEEQVLQTARKTVMENITVREIPYTEVTNVQGGLTVSIG